MGIASGKKAEPPARRAHLFGVADDAREDPFRDLEEPAELGIPLRAGEVHQRSVRDAFVTSVTWTVSARISRWMRKLSIVPDAISPCGSRGRALARHVSEEPRDR